MNDRWFLKLYPREWRERYGDEFSAMVGDRRLSLENSIDLISGAIDARFTKGAKMPSTYWNDQAQRTTRALAQAAGAVILFQTFVPPVVTAIIGVRSFGVTSFGMGMLWGFVSSLLQSAVTLGPVALVSAVIPWRQVPYARLSASLLSAFIGFRIASHVAWGPAELALLLASVWIGYGTVSREHGVPHEVAAEV